MAQAMHNENSQEVAMLIKLSIANEMLPKVQDEDDYVRIWISLKSHMKH